MAFHNLQDIFDDDDLGLLNSAITTPAVTPDERLADSFQEINKFYEANGRSTESNSSNISEYKLYCRLQALCKDPEKIVKLKSLDTHNLLQPVTSPKSITEVL